MISRTTLFSYLVSVLSLLLPSRSVAQDASEPTSGKIEKIGASGTFAPAGPPLEQPVRVDVGGSCVIDLRQAYDISGTLSGSLEIDYRIVVYSPCVTAVPGEYDEEWIAHGVFTGAIEGAKKSGSLTYMARVRAGGDIDGRIVVGGGIAGELAVSGNFSDGKLSYRGHVK